MNMDDKFDQDDTVTRKINLLEGLGVLDKPSDDPEAFGGITPITTYPFVKTKKGAGRLSRFFAWFKKN